MKLWGILTFYRNSLLLAYEYILRIFGQMSILLLYYGYQLFELFYLIFFVKNLNYMLFILYVRQKRMTNKFIS